MKYCLKYISRFSCEILILIVVGFYFSTTHSNSKLGLFNYQAPEVITGDGAGYYAYLPAIFIYNDLDYAFTEDNYHKYYSRNGISIFTNEINGEIVNKYFVGLSVLLLPFFLLAHFLSYLFGFNPDGYSIIYQYSIVSACFFYLWLGLVFVKKLLTLYATPPFISFTVLVLTVFGTNVFYYAMHEQSMTHIYSFALIAGFLFFSKNYFNNLKFNKLLYASLLLGLIVIIRPVNGIIILALPFISGSFESFKTGITIFFKPYKKSFFSLSLFLVVVLLQLIIWYAQTGSFIVWSYGGEGFNFLNPNIFNILFSYKKGLFVYTPIAFISLLGLVPIYRINKFSFYSISMFLFILTYVLSSWWSWDYGMCFGLRAFIDYYPLLSLLLAQAFLFLNKILLRTALLAIGVGAIILNLVQTDQYVRYIIHGTGMNKERYWKVFLKTSNDYSGIFYKEKYLETLAFTDPAFKTMNDFEEEYPSWRGDSNAISTDVFYSGQKSGRLDTNYIYSHTFFSTLNDSFASPDHYLKISVWCFLSSNAKGELIVSFDSEGISYKRFSEKLIQFINEEKQWGEMVIVHKFPKEIKAGDGLGVYVWNTGKSKIYIDDFKVEFLRVQP